MRLHRIARHDDDGFSLVEVLVAMVIVTGSLLALLGSSVYAVQATVIGRQNQQAGDYLNEAVEQVRGLDYSAVTMKDDTTLTPAQDGNVVGTGANRAFDADGDASTAAEKLDIRTVGSITPHITQQVTHNGTYTIKRYVSIPQGTTSNAQGEPEVRRLTVLVSWTTKGKVRTRKASTILTATRRGLPLPNYTWTYNGPATVVGTTPTQSKNPGAHVSFGFALKNLGARDSWALTANKTGWTFYRDTDQDGIWDEDLATEPKLMPASTGEIEASAAPVYVVAYRELADAEATGTQSITFSAASESQPTYPAKSVTVNLVVTSGVVVVPTTSPTPAPSSSPTESPTNCNPGSATSISAVSGDPAASTSKPYSLNGLYLYNGTAFGDTTTQANSSMGTDPYGLQSSLCNFSTDQGANQAGRYLGITGTTSPAQWSYQPPNKNAGTMSGAPGLKLFVQCPSGGTPTLTATLLKLSGTTTTTLATKSASPTGCGASNFVRLDFAFPTMSASIGTSEKLLLRVTTNAAVRLGYGAEGAKARLVVGTK